MTQLFDTATYDDSTDCSAPASTPLPRLLHAVTTTPDGAGPDQALSAQWRLDDSTIEIGRRGIAKARAALRDVNRSATPISTPPATEPLATIGSAGTRSGDADHDTASADANDDRPARKAA